MERITELPKVPTVEASSLCLLLGMVAGIIVVIDMRIHKGMSPNAIFACVGVLFGAILAWTCIDVIHVIQHPGELVEMEKEHK